MTQDEKLSETFLEYSQGCLRQKKKKVKFSPDFYINFLAYQKHAQVIMMMSV